MDTLTDFNRYLAFLENLENDSITFFLSLKCSFEKAEDSIEEYYNDCTISSAEYEQGKMNLRAFQTRYKILIDLEPDNFIQPGRVLVLEKRF